MKLEVVQTIEAHCCGEHLRIVFVPYIPGKSMQDKKEYCMRNLEKLRKMLMLEPRGHRNAYGVIATIPSNPEAHIGAIYMDPTGWHDMCGHATIGLVSIAIQLRLISIELNYSARNDVIVDTPAGLVNVGVYLDENARILRLSLINVPSFVHSWYSVKLEKHGKINVAVAFGGNFYAIVDLDELGIAFSTSREVLKELYRIAWEVWGQINGKAIVHPLNKKIRGLYGVRFIQRIDENKFYGILLYGNRENLVMDRSPSGTGSSAHLAYLYRKGLVKLGQEIEVLSPINTRFVVKALREVKISSYDAIVPEILTLDKGGFITGFASWIIDPEDQLKEGFLLN